MLTKNEIEEVNCLLDKKSKIEEMLRGFNSNHVYSKIGLVSVNSACKHEVAANDNANYFHNYMNDIEEQLTLISITLLKSKLAHIEAEFVKYIKEE